MINRSMLTPREVQIVYGAALGQTNKEIGHEVYLSENTVKTHFQRIYNKLRVADRSAAVAYGFKVGHLRWEGDNLLMDLTNALPPAWHHNLSLIDKCRANIAAGGNLNG